MVRENSAGVRRSTRLEEAPLLWATYSRGALASLACFWWGCEAGAWGTMVLAC
jgi:hypothetical protein